MTEISEGVVFRKDDLTVEAFDVDHGEIKPAFGFLITTQAFGGSQQNALARQHTGHEKPAPFELGHTAAIVGEIDDVGGGFLCQRINRR